MTHAALFCLIVLAAASHAVMDSIKDKRVHLARHPFRSFWHLVQYVRTLTWIFIGHVAPLSWRSDVWAFAICAGCGLVIGRLVWVRLYACPDYWLAVDESVRLGTGWRWLDRILGVHW